MPSSSIWQLEAAFQPQNTKVLVVIVTCICVCVLKGGLGSSHIMMGVAAAVTRKGGSLLPPNVQTS